MKKIMLLMTLCVIVMASCQKEESSDVNLDQALSGNLNARTALNNPDENAAYELGRKHKHGRDSACRKFPVEQLAQSILDYVMLNYPDATIELALTDRAGNFFTIIKLPDGTVKILQFDSSGNFVKELDKKVRGPKDPKKRLTKVDPSTLLPSIVSYVDSNYAGATILRAGTTPGGEFIVFIGLNGKHKALLFDANGNFVKELR